jgi:acyl carrier protein
MKAANTKLVTDLVASVLNLPKDAIGADASMENMSQWDSLGHLNICLAFQERFGVELDMETVARSTSVASLTELLPER